MIDIAKIAGVSYQTISNVINQPQKVRPETKKKIDKIIEKFHYEPVKAAQYLGKKKSQNSHNPTRSIGLIVPMYYDQMIGYFLAGYIDHIYKSLQARGYALLFMYKDLEIIARPDMHAKVFNKNLVDGLLMMESVDPEIFQYVSDQQIPVININPGAKTPVPYSSVMGDYFDNGIQITRYLLNMGHRDIAFITASKQLKRYLGYRSALTEAGITIDEDLTICQKRSDRLFYDGYQSMRQLIQRKKRCTALLAYSDFQALGAIKSAIENGLSVPGDISVMGFGNDILGEYFSPSLTTVDIQKKKLITAGVEMLLNLIENKDQDGVSITVPVSIIERESVKKFTNKEIRYEEKQEHS